MIFILFFSWRGGGGGGGVLGVLIGGSEKEHIVILCWGTHWEPKKNEKKSSPGPSSQNLKGIKTRHLECTLGPFHWLHEISIPKRVHHRLKLEWEMRKTGWGDRWGALCTRFTLV
jgi:hypothetical protein